MVGGEGAPWPPAMELVVAQSLPGRRRGEGMRALEGCRLGMDLAMAAGSHGGRRGSAWPPAMEFVEAQSQLGGGEGART